jgi:hypothetical protein
MAAKTGHAGLLYLLHAAVLATGYVQIIVILGMMQIAVLKQEDTGWHTEYLLQLL